MGNEDTDQLPLALDAPLVELPGATWRLSPAERRRGLRHVQELRRRISDVENPAEGGATAA